MKTVRLVSSVLFYVSRAAAFLFLLTAVYSAGVVLLYYYSSSSALPIQITDQYFTIFYPFTRKPFLLGDYTASFLFSSFLTIAFYGLFLWLLSDVFRAFRQQKLFTKKGVSRLSRFYITNLLVPLLLLLMLLLFQNDISDLVRIMFLHLVIGIFAWFMAAIFKQGVILQEEQDLTF
jgi:hypothetical protein